MRRPGSRITVVTAGHLSTCPLMLKSADALERAGDDVRVIATRHEPWAVETDLDLASRRPWKAEVIDYRRGAGAAYWRTGARFRGSKALAGAVGPTRIPLAVVSRAFSRVHSELVRTIAA